MKVELAKLIPGINSLFSRVSDLESRLTSGRVLEPANPLPLQDWWTRSFWEPTVALAIRDHCRPGDVVFDVGCNAGGTALIMSRLVGPRGIVLAFEASPRIIDKTHQNLVTAGCHNVTLFHRAVWHTTGLVVNMTAGSHLNDRIDGAANDGMPVRTVALDDLAAAGDFRPSFIKMDIEGAEFEALRGMQRLLANERPVLVLEQSPDDMRCHRLLTEAGYRGVDLSTYRQISGPMDFGRGAVANVLFVPRERAAGSPYFSDLKLEEIEVVPSERFIQANNGDVRLRGALSLTAGRYLISADFTALGTDNAVFAGLEANGEVIFRYHTHTRFLADSYANWVIHLDHEAQVAPFLLFQQGADPTLIWNGVTVFRLPSFHGSTAPVIE